jgi:hypothetical protein
LKLLRIDTVKTGSIHTVRASNEDGSKVWVGFDESIELAIAKLINVLLIEKAEYPTNLLRELVETMNMESIYDKAETFINGLDK